MPQDWKSQESRCIPIYISYSFLFFLYSSFASEIISQSALPQSTICLRPHFGHWYSRISRPVKVVRSIWSISTAQSGQVVSLIIVKCSPSWKNEKLTTDKH